MDNKVSESVEIESPEVARTENVCKPVEHVKNRRNTKEEKARKKDEKSVEQVLKALSTLETPEERLAAMCKKYSEILDDNRKLQATLKQTEKKVIVTQREKEQFQSEHSKAILTRSRLESLCRELQRQNKAVKEESLLKIREASTKFQSTLAEITTVMTQNNEKTSKLYDDKLEMAERFKSVCEQYKIREQHIEKMQQQLKLENQLAEAKLAKAKMEMSAEKEALLKEKQQLLLNLTEYQVKIREHQATEIALRGQISMYTDKYDEFQSALTKSNEVFGGFKDEMEKMSKKILKLEKETSSWKQRWENSHAALLDMAADKQQRDATLASTNKKLAQLQQLCRALQEERTSLLAQLRSKTDSTTAVAESTEQTETAENLKSIKQVDDLSNDCQQLKDNLVQFQGTLTEAIEKAAEEKSAHEMEQTSESKAETNVEEPANTESRETDVKKLENGTTVEESDVENRTSPQTVVELNETKPENVIVVENIATVPQKDTNATTNGGEKTESSTDSTAEVDVIEKSSEDSAETIEDVKSNDAANKKGKDGKKKKK